MEFCHDKYSLKSDIITTEVENLQNNECSRSSLSSLKSLSKLIYDHLHQVNSLTELKTKSFRKLLIDDFDAEQIFQQIELQNKSALVHYSKHLIDISNENYHKSNIIVNDQSLFDKEVDDKIIQNYKSEVYESKGEYIFDDDSVSSMDTENDINLKHISDDEAEFTADENFLNENEADEKFLDKNGAEENFSDKNEADEYLEDDSKNNSKSSKLKKVSFLNQTKPKYKSAVDDQFFKLSNLDEFLKVEDLRAEDKLNEEDEDIDYFQDIPSDDFEDSDADIENIMVDKASKDIMYDDFFDAPGSGDESADNQDDLLNQESNYESDYEDDQNKIDDDDNTEMNDDVEKDEVHENDVNLQTSNCIINSKTPFEIEQERIKETISSYEENILKTPEWHLTGEVVASSRPKDSLLHQETDFDVNAKPVLVEDATLEEKTEKAIKTIIKNKAFSDGQRTIKPVNDIIQKKEIILDQNKSKKSLAEVYADEYLKKKYGEEEEENPKHVEIKKMMDTLLPELQALFCHIPKPAIPDIKIVSNLPAITVEEVAPTSISDVTLLAPEEIKKRSGLIKGQSERTDTDRKRERRKKKILQRNKFKKLQTETANMNSLSAKSRKLDKINTMRKIKQHRNTKIAEMGVEKIKSSKDFFSRLQETVNSKVQPSQAKKRQN